MFDPILLNVLAMPDFVAIAADADALAFGISLVTQTNSDLVAYHDIVKMGTYGKPIADALYNAMKASGDEAASLQFVTRGIDVSLPVTQTGLDEIAAQNSSNIVLVADCASIKLMGVWSITVFAHRGVTWVPTVQDITTHRTALIAKQNWMHVNNDIVPTLLQSGASWNTIKTAIAGVN